uniref:Uncharacterized protein n=1 Tax=Branchiostoma floridae TaxID=7739 RepID=C3ZKE4_BRAFL|eukprot:XP_002591032.1 hypothetical protein BRAFLDRAFT_69415 [Branchiostoma floridae]
MSCHRLCSRQLQNLVKTFCLRKDLTVGPSTAKIFYTARNYLAGKIPGELVFAGTNVLSPQVFYTARISVSEDDAKVLFAYKFLQDIESYTFYWENEGGLLKLLRDDKLVDWSKNFTIAGIPKK